MEPSFAQSPNGHLDDEINLRDLWNLLGRNRGIVTGCLAATVAAAVGLTLLATPIYEASTSIRIDEKQTNLPVLDVLQTISTGSEVDTEMEVLRSRTLAELVVDSLGLQLTVRKPKRIARKEILDYVRVSRHAPEGEYVLRRTDDGRFSVRDVENSVDLGSFAIGQRIDLPGATIVLAPSAAAYDEIRFETILFEDAVEDLRETLSISRPNRLANIIVARYESADTVLVHQVPNQLAQAFIAQRNQIKKTEARSTVEFLREQIDTLAAQLTAAEEALRAFREGEQVISLETEASAQVQRLAELQAQRNIFASEHEALAALLEEVRNTPVEEGGPSPYRRLMGFPSLLRNQAASELLRSLAEVENERATLLRTLTERHDDVVILTARIRELEDQLRAIATAYLQGLANQVAALDETLSRFGAELAAIPTKEVQFARLKRQTAVLEEIYTFLQTRLKEAEIVEAVEDPTVRVVDPATRPIEPIKPRGMLNVALGVVVGLMLGVGVAFLREFTDTTVHTREDVQAIVGVPVLGMIPRIQASAVAANGKNGSGKARLQKSAVGVQELEARLITGYDPHNPVSEAYRSLRTNITFSRLDSTPRTLVFTSPVPGEGKSTTAANLAITLAQQGLKVLLVDADLRRGVLNSVFHLEREPGLSDVLLGTTPFEEAVRTVRLGGSGTLDVLTSGTFPPNPAELLGSKQMRTLLERLEERFDTIILDAPPLNIVTDAALLGTNADGVIVVARAGRTEKAALAYAVEQLRNVRAGVLGTVLNDIDFKRDGRYYGKYGSYGNYYQYYYSNEGHV